MGIPLLIPVAMIDPTEAAPSDLAVKVVSAMWTARLRTDLAAIFRTSVSKISSAVASIGPMAGDLAVTVLAAEDSAAVAIALVVAASAAGAALAVSAAAEGADGNN